jgi:hypothetical protein
MLNLAFNAQGSTRIIVAEFSTSQVELLKFSTQVESYYLNSLFKG